MHNAQDSVKEGYEVTDMNTRVIVYFLIGLFLLLFGSVGAILMVMRGFEESQSPLNTTPASPLATPGMQMPAEPHLQMDPVTDRKVRTAEDYARIESYGLVDTQDATGRVHIPIGQAMERIANGSAVYRQPPATALLPNAEQ